MSFITAIGTATPVHQFRQTALADFMVQAMQLTAGDERKLRAIFKMSGIESRYSVLDDYGRQSGFSFFGNQNNLEPIPTTKTRVDFFRQQAVALSTTSVKKCFARRGTHAQSITHLIVVSCTGMYAPGLDIDLVRHLTLRPTVQRTCINFMGCYAAFNAIKLADSICRSQSATVLIVCTELCSLHFQKQPTEDNFLANALFADGSAAMLVESQPHANINLQPLEFHCDLEPSGEKDMTWTVGDFGFEMRLSAYVPDLIKRGIGRLTETLLQNVGQPVSSIPYFAIHPGGKKILEAIEAALNLTRANTEPSYRVLNNFGNMSSPTVIFVLQQIMDSLTRADEGRNILSFAFGPGLTLESMLLKITHGNT